MTSAKRHANVIKNCDCLTVRKYIYLVSIIIINLLIENNVRSNLHAIRNLLLNVSKWHYEYFMISFILLFSLQATLFCFNELLMMHEEFVTCTKFSFNDTNYHALLVSLGHLSWSSFREYQKSTLRVAISRSREQNKNSKTEEYRYLDYLLIDWSIDWRMNSLIEYSSQGSNEEGKISKVYAIW